MRKNGRIIIKILILCLIVVLGILYFENFKLEKLIIEGGTHYSPEEIEAKLVKSKADGFTHYFYLKNAVFSSPDPIPFVEKMDFEIIDKNTIHVQVYDKMIAGCVEHMGRYMHFDREGIVVESSDKPDDGIPVITGIEFSKVVIGEKMEIEDNGLFSVILNLTQSLQKNGIKCERIHFDIRQNIKLYIGGSEALLGGGGIHDYQISVLKKVLLESGGVDYRYDLRNYTEESGEVPAKKINNDKE